MRPDRITYERGLVGSPFCIEITPPGRRLYCGMNLGREGKDTMLKLSERELCGMIAALTGVEVEVRL